MEAVMETESVTHCTGCPFRHFFGTYDDLACWADDMREFTATENDAEEPPEWCPLRAAPRLVQLRMDEENPDAAREDDAGA